MIRLLLTVSFYFLITSHAFSASQDRLINENTYVAGQLVRIQNLEIQREINGTIVEYHKKEGENHFVKRLNSFEILRSENIQPVEPNTLTVTICNLPRGNHLNGKQVRYYTFDPETCYHILNLSDDLQIRVKRENFIILESRMNTYSYDTLRYLFNAPPEIIFYLYLLHQSSPQHRRGLSIDEIDSFAPKQNAKNVPSDCFCSICLEKIENEQHVRKTKCCKNLFHETCLETWLSCKNNCPNCRAYHTPPLESSPEID